MIKIQEHLDRANPEVYLDTLALSLWEHLNPKRKSDGELKDTSTINLCEDYYKLTVTNKYIKDYADNVKTTAQRHRRFFKYLKKEKNKNLKRIIIGQPTEFDTILTEVFKILRIEDLYIKSGEKISQTKFSKLLNSTIFNYKKLRSSSFCSELYKTIGFKNAICPYCNDRKVEVLNVEQDATKKEKLKAYFDLDHFYPKSQNPFFAVSFYNLIPSCHTCNSSEKSDLPFTIASHIHPYHDSFEDLFKFKISLKTQLGDKADEITFVPLTARLTDGVIEDLKLDVRYKNNIESANELVTLYNKYKHYLSSPDRTMFIEMILKSIPTQRKKILSFSKAKLNRDVLKQLDIANDLAID